MFGQYITHMSIKFMFRLRVINYDTTCVLYFILMSKLLYICLAFRLHFIDEHVYVNMYMHYQNGS